MEKATADQASSPSSRHWIIIATGEEISSLKSRAAGVKCSFDVHETPADPACLQISYLTLDEAEAELAKAPFVGPH